MKKIIRLTESDLARIIKRVIKESNDDPKMYHRYTKGGNPGVEKFLSDPLNNAIARELEQQLENDEYANIDNPTNIGKGTRTMRIVFNNRKMTVDDFIDQIQEDAEALTCHTITDYDYNNRILRSTIITINTEEGPCKKKDVDKKVDPKPDPKPKPKKECKYENTAIDPRIINGGEESIKMFQRWCKNKGYYKGIYSDGSTSTCQEIDGKIGCCSKTCFALHKEELLSPR